MTDTKRRPGLRFVLRQPLAVLGAVGFLSLAQGLVEWQEPFQSWLNEFRDVTRSAWDLLLGWLFRLSGSDQPFWLKDYLTAGAIVFGLSFGARLLQRDDGELGHPVIFAIFLIQCFLFWPLLVLYGLLITATILLSGTGDSNERLHARLYGEMFIWLLIIIAAGYVMR